MVVLNDIMINFEDGLSGTSPSTFSSMLDFIDSDIKPDLAFWSGNVLAHSHQTDKSDRLNRINEVVDTFERKLGSEVKLYLTPGSDDSV